jgi:F-type H+-transporting ATPase subunit b
MLASDSGHAAGAHEPTSLWDLPKRWDLSIYTCIVFLLLLFILSKFAWPQITAGLKAREDLIAQAKDEAIKAKQDAVAMQTKLQAEFAAASDKIRAMMDEARRDADVLRVKEREAGVKEAAAERDRAKREIETAKDQALQEIYQKSVDVAALMSSKAIKRNMTAADHSRLIDEALSDLNLSVSRN